MNGLGLMLLVAALSVAVFGPRAEAQLNSVTRLTFQGTPTFNFVCVTNMLAQVLVRPAPAPAAPAVVVAPPPARMTPTERAEMVQRVVAFQKARAAQGLPRSQYDLGMRYLTGDGVEKDTALARHWLQRAAEQSNDLARDKLQELEKKSSAPPGGH